MHQKAAEGNSVVLQAPCFLIEGDPGTDADPPGGAAWAAPGRVAAGRSPRWVQRLTLLVAEPRMISPTLVPRTLVSTTWIMFTVMPDAVLPFPVTVCSLRIT